MITKDIAYVVDGATMIGRLALPDGDGMRPGILIAHEGNGLDDVQRSRAERFAELGYVAFALDYQGGGKVPDDREAMTARGRSLRENPGLGRAVAKAGL